MAPQNIIVKRHGHMEAYDEKKVYGSVYAAALNAHLSEQEAESLAEKVMKAVNARVRSRENVDSSQIKELIVKELGGPDNDVAYLYVHHLDIN